MLTLAQSLYAFQVVPPPPPPGGSELWSGTSEIIVPGSTDPNCEICIREVNTFIFGTFCIEYAPCETEDYSIFRDFTSDQLRRALNNFISLPGGYRGYNSIITGITSGKLLLDEDDWDELVSWVTSNNSSAIGTPCALARQDGYDPPGCATIAPLPKNLTILLILSFVFIFFYHSNKFSVFADGKNG